MAKNSITVPFDKERFAKVCERMGTNLSNVAEEMGKSHAYFNGRSKAGTLPQLDAFWLESVKGIKPEEYAPRATLASKPKADVDLVNIRTAVRGVVKDVINERISNDDFIAALRGIIRPTVRALLEEERALLAQTVTEAIEEVLK